MIRLLREHVVQVYTEINNHFITFLFHYIKHFLTCNICISLHVYLHTMRQIKMFPQCQNTIILNVIYQRTFEDAHPFASPTNDSNNLKSNGHVTQNYSHMQLDDCRDML